MVEQGTPGERAHPGPLGEQVNINEANREDLRAVRGLGDARADQIVTWREQHGPFRSVEDLQQLSQFPPEVVRELKDRLRV